MKKVLCAIIVVVNKVKEENCSDAHSFQLCSTDSTELKF